MRRTDWLVALSDAPLAELETAADTFQAEGRPIETVAAGDVTLPGFGPLLGAVETDVVKGRSFVLLRGLPVGRWYLDTTAPAYWIIGTRLGHAVPQTAQGHLLGHVRDLGNHRESPKTRIYTTRAAQEFHTDSCNIVGLYVPQTRRQERRQQFGEFDSHL